MSIPISLIALTAIGFSPTGRVPALNTSYLSPAMCRRRPSAIWLRAEFPVQRIKTRCFFTEPPYLSDSGPQPARGAARDRLAHQPAKESARLEWPNRFAPLRCSGVQAHHAV